MRKLIMIVALFVGVNATVSAQDGKKNREAFKNMTPEQRAEQQTARMEKNLQLNDAQKKAILELNLNSAKEFQGLKAERKALNEKGKALHQARQEKLKSILSADQFAQLQKQQADRKAKMAERRKAGKGRAGHGENRTRTLQSTQPNPVK
jgi:hypothetical protein